MCGIVGTCKFGDKQLIRRMTDVMAHRGPDDSGVEFFTSTEMRVGLGHARLSIIDLSPAGHQPMSNEDDRVWIAFNGEIYNFQPIREELMSKGHVFKSKTDTEVILHGYEEWGTDLFARLNGIFAFAIFDQRKDAVYLVRDRFGVKPLYVTDVGEGMAFASEIKSLLEIPGLKREVNMEALLAMANYRYTPEPISLFKGVEKLQPGHWMRIDKLGRTTGQYYEASYEEPESEGNESELADELEHRLKEAVARQQISDVEVGFFLSGGVDSSALVALSELTKEREVKSFTIGFRSEDSVGEGQPDDVKYARMMAKQFNCDHQEIILDPKIVDQLPEVIYHLDEPVADPAAISSFLICKEARKQGIKVLMSGQGGDEVFCGYPWHLGAHLAERYRKIPAPFRKLGEGVIRKLPAGSSGRLAGPLRRIRKFCASASEGFEGSLLGFLSYAGQSDLEGLLGERYGEASANGQPHRLHRQLLDESKDLHYVNRMLHLDMGTFLPSLNLNYTDKTSMAHGTEVRVPLIDNEIVDFMGKVHTNLKIRGRERKYLLKKSLEKVLPREVIYRKKGGFGAPIRTWVRRDLREMINDCLSESKVKERGYFNPKFVSQIIKQNDERRQDFSYLIYFLLSFELWHQKFIDA